MEIKIYECDLAPYKLPRYVPIRIFTLEYIRQMINSDDINFVTLKKKRQLRIKGQIGSFICNSRYAREEGNKLLKEMKFGSSFPWHYDPCGIIAKMRLRNKISPYAHVPKPEIEKFMNQIEWEVNTLEDAEQQSPLDILSQTTTPQIPKEKKPKTSHTNDRSREEETWSTTVVEGEHSPLFLGNKKMMSTSSSKK
jgi:hypothetical protein